MSGDNQFSYKFLQKVENINEKAGMKSPVSFDLLEFMEYVRSPKDYSFIVLFTAVGSHSNICEKCEEVRKEFEIITNCFKKSSEYKNKKLFFGTVDFEKESDVLNILGNEKAPIVMHYPPSGVPGLADAMDLEKHGIESEAICKWVETRTGIKIKISRSKFSLSFGNLRTRIIRLRKYYRKKIWNVNTAAILATIFCYEMSSGFVWNSVRGPPLYSIDSHGPVFFQQENQFQHQHLIESYIYIFLNCNIAFGMHLVIKAAAGKGKMKNSKAVIGTLLVVISFSVLLSIFRFKIKGYPFRFLFE